MVSDPYSGGLGCDCLEGSVVGSRFDDFLFGTIKVCLTIIFVLLTVIMLGFVIYLGLIAMGLAK
jgi:hypothetical protein